MQGMRKSALTTALWLVAVFAAFVYWHYRNGTGPQTLGTEPISETAHPTSGKMRLVARPQTSTVNRVAIQSPPLAASGADPSMKQMGSQASVQIRPAPPPHAVPFKMHGNIAVAYGDIALGMMDPKAPQEGYAKTAPLVLWTGNVIPYTISPKLTNIDRIARVVAYFNQNTPVRFVPWQGQADAIVFEPGDKICMSYLGKVGGIQPIYLSDGCHDHEIEHEIMHALGFIHEQSRPDRDQYIKINWNEIEPDAIAQFDIAPGEITGPVEHRRFDYTSIMLYPPTMFAKTHGAKVLESVTGENIDPVQEGLSREDIDRVYSLYGH
jgi:hypothetical protein